MLFGRTPNPITHLEADRPELVRIHKQPPIKDKCWLVHTRVHSLPVDRLEFGPLGRDNDCLGILAGFQCGRADENLALNFASSISCRNVMQETVAYSQQGARQG